MGFSITPLAQKARTATLITDSDLNLGNYDLIATDVKGDTAEFDEFVGGVGNFSNVLGSGNLDIEGTGNIKGLTTFQNAVQVNGALHVEGSINNVNIADNGEITTAQGVNGADFNGVPIKSSGVYTVTPVDFAFYFVPQHTYDNTSESLNNLLTILPYRPNCLYTGSITIRYVYGASASSNEISLYYNNGLQALTQVLTLEGSAQNVYNKTFSFVNIPYLNMSAAYNYGSVEFGTFKLT